MKLTSDFLNILAKYRNCIEIDDPSFLEEDALAAIEKIKNLYEKIAAEQRISGYNRVRDRYEQRIKKIGRMVEKAKLFVILLSEDDYVTRKSINDLLDAEISGCDTDEVGGDSHAEAIGSECDDG